MGSLDEMSNADVHDWNRWRGGIESLVHAHEISIKEIQASLQQILMAQMELKNYFGKILFRAAGSTLIAGIVLGIAFKEVLPWLARLVG